MSRSYLIEILVLILFFNVTVHTETAENNNTSHLLNSAVSSVLPVENSHNASTTTNISITFAEDINPSTINSSTIIVNSSERGVCGGTVSYNSSSMTATFVPDRIFNNGEHVTVTATTAILLLSGSPLVNGYSWSFTIEVSGGSGEYDSLVSFQVNKDIQSVALADLDGDFDLDLISSSIGWTQPESTFCILINDGNGSFSKSATYTAGKQLKSIRSADFNRNGYPDLVVTNSNDNNISVYFNDGSAQMTFDTLYQIGNHPDFIIAEDFDNDGYIDLAVANNDDQSVSILINDQAGRFTVDSTYVGGTNAFHLAKGDFDSDGDIDLVTTQMTLLLNDGSGVFSDPINFPAPIWSSDILAADLDSDGDLDLAAVLPLLGAVSVFINNGDANFTFSQNYSTDTNPQEIYLGDVDSDGDIDITTTGATVSILKNNGDATFGTKLSYPASNCPNTLTGGDIDSDGDIDLVVGQCNGFVAVLFNKYSSCCIGIRGNADNSPDNVFDVSDIVFLVNYVFKEGPFPECDEETDANGSGGFDVSDIVYMVAFMFKEGPELFPCP